jgi:hypothetical protein
MRQFAAAALVLCAGCQNNFEPASFVTGLRVLAIKAEPPEVAPGETSTLTALAVDTSGNQVGFDWSLCNLPPGPVDPAVNLTCVNTDAGAPAIVPLGGGPQLTVTMPQVTPQQLGVPDYTFGVFVPFRLRVDGLPTPGLDAGVGIDEIVAFYRLRLATGLEARNTNPRLTGVFVAAGPGFPDAGLDSITPLDDAHPVSLAAGETLTLRALIDINSVEKFLIVDGDPRQRQFTLVEEQPRILWYATAGSFEHQVTGLNAADTRFALDVHVPAAGSTITLWVVVHDERGGTDFLTRSIAVRSP